LRSAQAVEDQQGGEQRHRHLQRESSMPPFEKWTDQRNVQGSKLRRAIEFCELANGEASGNGSRVNPDIRFTVAGVRRLPPNSSPDKSRIPIANRGNKKASDPGTHMRTPAATDQQGRRCRPLADAQIIGYNTWLENVSSADRAVFAHRQNQVRHTSQDDQRG